MSRFSSMANYFFCLFQFNFFSTICKDVENYFIKPLSANPTKCSNALKQFARVNTALQFRPNG